MFKPAEDIPHLTGLRALAALMVLSLHLSQPHGHYLEIYVIVVDQGFLGVDIFFVLSGYILSYVYASGFQSVLPKAYGLFLWRRFARLYPVHIATLFRLALMVGSRGLLDTNFWVVSEIPRHLLMAHAWTEAISWNIPAWSISAEWLAYMLFPLFIWVFLRPRLSVLPLFAGLALLLGFQFVGIAEGGIARSFTGWPAFWRIVSEFGLGVLLFRLAHGIAPSKRYDWIALALFAFIFVVPYEILKVVAIAGFVAMVARSDGFLKAFFATRTAVYLGTISYSIYMIHYPLLKMILYLEHLMGIKSEGPLISLILVAIWGAFVIGLAAALYHFVEAPGRRWFRSKESLWMSA